MANPLQFALMSAVVLIGSAVFASQHLSQIGAPPSGPSLGGTASPQREAPRATSFGGPMVIRASTNGHYYVTGESAGLNIPMLVDTGATQVTLTFEDARKLGLWPSPHEYTVSIVTANGVQKAANARLSELRIGNIMVRDVEALVMPEGALQIILLGMSFLGRLQSFSSKDGELTIRG